MFSIVCGICVVPGMGTIDGFCAKSHASAIWAGVAYFRTTQILTKKLGYKPRLSRRL
jgi:hypothetical protein